MKLRVGRLIREIRARTSSLGPERNPSSNLLQVISHDHHVKDTKGSGKNFHSGMDSKMDANLSNNPEARHFAGEALTRG